MQLVCDFTTKKKFLSFGDLISSFIFYLFNNLTSHTVSFVLRNNLSQQGPAEEQIKKLPVTDYIFTKMNDSS